MRGRMSLTQRIPSVGTLLRSLLVLALLPLLLGAQEPAPSKAEAKKITRKSRKLLKSAVKLIGKGEYLPATNALDSIFALTDTNADAYYYYGRVLLAQGDTTQADSILALGVEKAPKSARLKILLARIKLAHNETDDALALTEGVLAINPRQAEALYLKGLGQLQLGDSTNALISLETAAEIAISKGEQ